jgi:hypothetical protein
MAAQMVTANRLRDGAVVFQAADAGWVARVEDGGVTESEAEAAERLRAAEAQPTLVVGPYLIEVDGEPGGWVPRRYRERIRAEGPSIGRRPDAAVEGT